MSKKKPEKKRHIILLIALIVVLLIIDYPILDDLLEDALIDYEIETVIRVIDGDTLVVEGSNVRLLGINSPERGEVYYEEAKNYLENLTLNKTVRLKKGKEDLDRYNRKLRYIFLNGENINLKMVEKGLANYYFPSGKDHYYKKFQDAWKSCIEKEENLCGVSEEKCSNCVVLKEFNYREQKVVFENLCHFYCDLKGWSIKDEGRKKFIFPEFILEKQIKIQVGDGENQKDVLYWKGEDYVWTRTGDTLFLRDKENKLVLWEGY